MTAPIAQKAKEVDKVTIGDVLRAWDSGLSKTPPIPLHHWKVLRGLKACRTPDMGGHVYRCGDCRRDHFVPHSCRNRHCPTCQPSLSKDWMTKQVQSLLPVPYFHIVFTLPHELNPLIAQNQALLYKLLFDSVSETLLTFGQNRFKAQIGITSVLHTWSQSLGDHYHLHCIVTGGGLDTKTEEWKACSKFFIFPVKALSKVYRAKYRDGLKELFHQGKLEFHGNLKELSEPANFNHLVAKACRQPWVVYAKRPFAGPEQVIAYLARYTHKVGITNSRIQKLDEENRTVTFSYRDYADESSIKSMKLDLDEFVRRFRLHILPKRFVKIRHYGILSNRNRASNISKAREALGAEPQVIPEPKDDQTEPEEEDSEPIPGTACPYCGSERIALIMSFNRPSFKTRPPPD